MTARTEEPVGTFCLVLHTHLPWLAHHGTWPVGEEWLYQAWATSYLPVLDLLHRFADEGREDVLTLGMTPVLAAQLDDPYCLREVRTWAGFWQARAEGLAHRDEDHLRETGSREFRASQRWFAVEWKDAGGATLTQEIHPVGVAGAGTMWNFSGHYPLSPPPAAASARLAR